MFTPYAVPYHIYPTSCVVAISNATCTDYYIPRIIDPYREWLLKRTNHKRTLPSTLIYTQSKRYSEPPMMTGSSLSAHEYALVISHSRSASDRLRGAQTLMAFSILYSRIGAVLKIDKIEVLSSGLLKVLSMTIRKTRHAMALPRAREGAARRSRYSAGRLVENVSMILVMENPIVTLRGHKNAGQVMMYCFILTKKKSYA